MKKFCFPDYYYWRRMYQSILEGDIYECTYFFHHLRYSIIKSSNLRLGSHVLKNFALNRAVSVCLSIEVLSAIAHSMASIASDWHFNALWAVHDWAAIAAIGNDICTSKGKAHSMSSNGLVETVWDSLNLSSGCIISIQLINARF